MRIPLRVRDRVRRYMEHRYPKKKYFRENELLNMVSPTLAVVGAATYTDSPHYGNKTHGRNKNLRE